MKASSVWLDAIYDLGLFGGAALLAFLPAILIQQLFNLAGTHLLVIWGVIVLGLLLFFIPFVSLKLTRNTYRWFISGKYKRDLKLVKTKIPLLLAEIKDLVFKR